MKPSCTNICNRFILKSNRLYILLFARLILLFGEHCLYFTDFQFPSSFFCPCLSILTSCLHDVCDFGSKRGERFHGWQDAGRMFAALPFQMVHSLLFDCHCSPSVHFLQILPSDHFILSTALVRFLFQINSITPFLQELY